MVLIHVCLMVGVGCFNAMLMSCDGRLGLDADTDLMRHLLECCGITELALAQTLSHSVVLIPTIILIVSISVGGQAGSRAGVSVSAIGGKLC